MKRAPSRPKKTLSSQVHFCAVGPFSRPHTPADADGGLLAVPSEDYSRQPPRCAGLESSEGR